MITRRSLLAAGGSGLLGFGSGGMMAAERVFAIDRDAPHVPGDDARVEIYRAVHEDTFIALARRFDLGYVEIVAANPGVDRWIPGAGTPIVLPTIHLLPDAPREGVVINLAEMRLYWFAAPDTWTSFPIGIGREGRGTPLGATTIVRKAKDPTWRPPESIRAEKPELPAVVPPGPDNPLGTRALYLGWPLYLIHGTNKPEGVGRRVSAGCIRMYPEDVELVYELIREGTPVTVVDQDVKFGWIDGDLFIEAHPSQAQADAFEVGDPVAPEIPEDLMLRAMDAAGTEFDRLHPAAVEEAVMQRRGYPIRVVA